MSLYNLQIIISCEQTTSRIDQNTLRIESRRQNGGTLHLSLLGKAVESCWTLRGTFCFRNDCVLNSVGYSIWREFWRVCVLAFADEVDHLIYLFLLVVQVQRLHASLEIGRSEAFCSVTQKNRINFMYPTISTVGLVT